LVSLEANIIGYWILGVFLGIVLTLVNVAHDVIEWHNILGHCNCDDVLKLENVVDGMKVIGDKVKPAVCDVCVCKAK